MKINGAEARRRLESSKNLTNLASAPPDSAASQQVSIVLPSNVQPEPLPVIDSAVAESTQEQQVIHKLRNVDRGVRGPGIPEFMRDTIGYLRDSGVQGRAIAQAFGIPEGSVCQSYTGHVGAKPPTEARRAKIAERRLNIQDQALLKLMESLNLIDVDKLGDASAKELSGIAVNLAKVSQLSSDERIDGGQTNIVVYAPQLREESKFKVIEVDH